MPAPAAERMVELSVFSLLRVLWERKASVIGFALLSLAVATAAALMLPREYRASVVLAPVTDGAMGGRLGAGTSALSSNLSALAPLLGNLTPEAGQKAEALAALRSQLLTQTYIESHDLVRVLFDDRWDAVRSRWKTSLFHPRAPSPWIATKFFDQYVRSIYTDSKSGLTTLTIEWRDPDQAATWANDLVRLTNEHLRDRAVEEADRNVGYLRKQLATSDVVAVQNALGMLLQGELRKGMLARGTPEYALKVLDPARAPESASSPLLIPWMVAGLLFGLAVSVTTVLTRALGPIRLYAGPRIPE